MRRRSMSYVVTSTLAAALLVAVVAASGAGAARTASKLVYCSDIAYPPEEFYKGSTPVGSDIDIGTNIAKRLGRAASFQNTGFDGIIAALESQKCDLIISGMNNTPARRKQVNFVNYIKVGQGFMVNKGNPKHITTIASLSGKSVGVETGTTNLDYLNAQSKKLSAAGKKGFNVVAFPKDTDGANALKAKKVDAYFTDAPVVAYYIGKDPSSFQFGGKTINAIPVGIAVRKSDTKLRAQVQHAVKAMYKDGTMLKILKKWKLQSAALKIKK
jgi:polar amino acid transport system substrate-binding protein